MPSSQIWFLRCPSSETRTPTNPPECPVILLPRHSSLGDYVARRYRRKGEPIWIDKGAMPLQAGQEGPAPWFDFACMNCRRWFTYFKEPPIEGLDNLVSPEEYKILARQSDSKLFFELGIERSPKNPVDVPDKVYAVAEKNISDHNLIEKILRIIRVGEDSTRYLDPDSKELPSVPERISIIDRVPYDFL